jgi:hypothetical protein
VAQTITTTRMFRKFWRFVSFRVVLMLLSYSMERSEIKFWEMLWLVAM